MRNTGFAYQQVGGSGRNLWVASGRRHRGSDDGDCLDGAVIGAASGEPTTLSFADGQPSSSENCRTRVGAGLPVGSPGPATHAA